MAVSNWKTVAASIAAALTLTASLAAALAALYQARMASEQVAVLHQQTLISQYTTNAQMLGNTDIAVRIGAIQSLGLLASELPERFHIQVMQLLSAFIRQPPPTTPRKNELRADVQAALDVIIYRNAASLRIEEVHRTKRFDRDGGQTHPEPVPIIDLRGSDLQWAELQRANLSHVVLNGAKLSYAHGHNATFANASLFFVSAKATLLPSTNFDGAKMIGADFSASQLQKSSFIATTMPWTMTNANLQESDLTRSIIAGSDLTGAKLKNADISGATIQAGSFERHVFDPTMRRDAIMPRCTVLTQSQLDTAIANPSKPPVLLSQAANAPTCSPLKWKREERGNVWKAHRRSPDNR